MAMRYEVDQPKRARTGDAYAPAHERYHSGDVVNLDGIKFRVVVNPHGTAVGRNGVLIMEEVTLWLKRWLPHPVDEEDY